MTSLVRRITALAVVFGVVFSAAAARAGDAEKHCAAIAPFLDEETILVAHLDVTRIDVDAAAAMLLEKPFAEPLKQVIEPAAAAAKAWLTAFQQAGGRDVYAAFSLSGLTRGKEVLFLVAPVAEGGSAQNLQAMIPQEPFDLVTRAGDQGPVIVVVDRSPTNEQKILDRFERGKRVERPRLDTALQAVDGAAIQIIFLPTEDHRRVLREMFPQLPKPLDAIDGPTLADGILWKGVGINLPPAFEVRSVVGATDPAAAERLAAGWKQVLDFAATEPMIRQHVPMIDDIVKLLEPTVEGDRLVVTVKEDAIEPIVERLLIPAVATSQKAAGRTRRMNQFKHLALAMHNWASANRETFPPSAIKGEDGKPLLSWRVALLPFIDQQTSYDQFHLDEPWDSEHNKKLIEKMPDVFKDHELSGLVGGGQLPPGYTTYVVPVGEGLVFGRKEGAALKEIKDGTSKTIMIVEVVPELAVPWTKPADWEVDDVRVDEKTLKITAGDPLKGVKRSDRKIFTAAFCDGSVHSIANDIDPSTFWHLLTRDGREPIGGF